MRPDQVQLRSPARKRGQASHEGREQITGLSGDWIGPAGIADVTGCRTPGPRGPANRRREDRGVRKRSRPRSAQDGPEQPAGRMAA